jgi:aspartyl-tRNA(Asn)/glutamyl-tRNA(Gln) amidotransferase subunit B
VLTAAREVGDYFERVVGAGADAKAASNWVMGEVMRELKERRIDADAFPVAADALAELVTFQSSGRINSSTAREVFAEMIASGRSAGDIVASRGLEQISDAGAIEAAAARILDDHPDEVARYIGGRNNLMKFFVGRLMKETRGKANPAVATGIFERLLEERRQGGRDAPP